MFCNRPARERGTSRCHSCLPVWRSRQMTNSLWLSLSLLCAVRKMRLRVSTGEEWPGGNGVFQKTFFSAPNWVGRPAVEETPVPLGPRNCDQSSAATEDSDD